MSELGYHIIYFDLDTAGYLNNDATSILNSRVIWDKAINNSSPCSDSWLHIEHDIQSQVVYSLVDYILQSLDASGFKAVTVGECLGDPSKNWYRAGTGSVPDYTFVAKAATDKCNVTSTSSTSTSTSTTTSTGSAASASSTASDLKVSQDASCGGTTGNTCQGSAFGSCCSKNGWCGSLSAYCDAGCQPAFGTCSSTSNSTTTGKVVSVDASCGGSNGYTCQGSVFGNCCSKSGWCGSTSVYCDTGCQPAFGTCSSTSNSTTTGKATSIDASCGGTNGYTCQGSLFGNCCSSGGWCGSTSAYCDAGCQPLFGSCNAVAVGASSNGTSSSARSSTSTSTRTSTSTLTSTSASSSTSTGTRSSSSGTCGSSANYKLLSWICIWRLLFSL
jgi:hypothetical protein